MNQVSILLVEDNASNAELVVRALQRPSIASDTVNLRDAQAALGSLSRTGEYIDRDTDTQPQLVALSSSLPASGGIKALKRLRENVKTWRIPDIAITHSNQKQDFPDCHNLGASRSLKKQVNTKDYGEALHQVGMYCMSLNAASQQGI